MYMLTQFSVFMVNKPGVLAKMLNEFATAKINLIAVSMMDSVEHGVMRLVGADADRIRKLLSRLNMQFSETDVLCVNLPNQPGAFAAVTQRLAEAHINIAYAYCTAGAKGGRTTGILKVADVNKAMKVLHEHGIREGKDQHAVRPAPSVRK